MQNNNIDYDLKTFNECKQKIINSENAFDIAHFLQVGFQKIKSGTLKQSLKEFAMSHSLSITSPEFSYNVDRADKGTRTINIDNMDPENLLIYAATELLINKACEQNHEVAAPSKDDIFKIGKKYE